MKTKKMSMLVVIMTAVAMLCSVASADTIWTGSINSDYSTAGNWNNALPSTANPGMIGATGDTGGRFDVTYPLRDSQLNDTVTVKGSSTLKGLATSFRGGNCTINLYDSSVFSIGADATVDSVNLYSATFNLYNNSSIATFDRQQSTTHTYSLYDSSTVAFARALGGTYNLAGASSLTISDTSVFGSNGAVLFDMIGGSLTMAGYNQSSFEALYAAANTANRLRYNGNNTATFSDVFQVSGSTITVIPEPATIGMLGLGAIITVLMRRMRTC